MRLAHRATVWRGLQAQFGLINPARHLVRIILFVPIIPRETVVSIVAMAEIIQLMTARNADLSLFFYQSNLPRFPHRAQLPHMD